MEQNNREAARSVFIPGVVSLPQVKDFSPPSNGDRSYGTIKV